MFILAPAAAMGVLAQEASAQREHLKMQQQAALDSSMLQVEVEGQYSAQLAAFYAQMNGYRSMTSVPPELKEAADPESDMFDPLTCIKNGVKYREPRKNKPR